MIVKYILIQSNYNFNVYELLLLFYIIKKIIIIRVQEMPFIYFFYMTETKNIFDPKYF